MRHTDIAIVGGGLAGSIACDRISLEKAFSVRAITIDDHAAWRALRAAKFLGHLGKGALRQAAAQLAVGPFRDVGRYA